MTTRGLIEPEMKKIAVWIKKVLTNIGDEKVYNEVRGEVRELCLQYPIYGYKPS
jgi:glycine hydroxymethyltransferase